jgi:hypothetical protein
MGSTRYCQSVNPGRNKREREETYRCLGDEVHNGEQLAAVGIDEGLVPCAGLLVLHLESVHERGGAVLLGEVLELRFWQTLVGASELLLSGRAGLLERDDGLGVGNSGWRTPRLDAIILLTKKQTHWG